MSRTYTKVFIHIVFSTKDRKKYITSEIGERLYSFIAGIARKNGFEVVIANGIEDHVHVLLKIPPRMAVSDAVRAIKAGSSKWIHELFTDSDKFSWQSGYSGFSVSSSHIKKVYDYIESQKEHHRRMTFKEELLKLLNRHNVEFDENYLWN